MGLMEKIGNRPRRVKGQIEPKIFYWIDKNGQILSDEEIAKWIADVEVLLKEAKKQIQKRKEIAEKYLNADDYRVRHQAEHEVEVFKWVLAVLGADSEKVKEENKNE
jgi:hypothetical protein